MRGVRLLILPWALAGLEAMAQEGGSVTVQNGGDAAANPAYLCNAGIRHRHNGTESAPVPGGDVIRFHDGENGWGSVRTRSDLQFDEISPTHKAMLDKDPALLLGSETYGSEYFFDVCLPRQEGQGGDTYAVQIQSTDLAAGNQGYLQLAKVTLQVEVQKGRCQGLPSDRGLPFSGQLRTLSWTLDRNQTCVVRFLFSETSDKPRPSLRQNARVILAFKMPERLAAPAATPGR